MKKNFTLKTIALALLCAAGIQSTSQMVTASLTGANLRQHGSTVEASYGTAHSTQVESRGGGCTNLTAVVEESLCYETGNGYVPSILITFNFDGGCTVDSLTVSIDGGALQALAIATLDLQTGEQLLLYLVTEDSVYDMTYVLDDGTESEVFTYTDDGCEDDPDICDCAYTVHSIGVLTWLGDTFADNGQYTWNGNDVDFNCANWGFDCGDIDEDLTDDPNGVCDGEGNLPPGSGCTVAVEEVATENLFSMYPNPANDNITLVNTSAASTLHARIYDTAGKMVWMRNISSTQGASHLLSFELAAGSYNLEVSTGNVVQRTTLVIQ